MTRAPDEREGRPVPTRAAPPTIDAASVPRPGPEHVSSAVADALVDLEMNTIVAVPGVFDIPLIRSAGGGRRG